MSVTLYPARATSVIVSVPAFTVRSGEQAPTGIVTVLPAYWKVKLPVTPVPSASLQICRRPFGMDVGVGVQFGAQPGVGVGVFDGLGVEVISGVGVCVGVGGPLTLFVKITSVTPAPISTITFASATSLLIARSGLTSMRET